MRIIILFIVLVLVSCTENSTNDKTETEETAFFQIDLEAEYIYTHKNWSDVDQVKGKLIEIDKLDNNREELCYWGKDGKIYKLEGSVFYIKETSEWLYFYNWGHYATCWKFYKNIKENKEEYTKFEHKYIKNSKFDSKPAWELSNWNGSQKAYILSDRLHVDLRQDVYYTLYKY